MAGLKTFWITISALLFLAACVPQSKQTECASNEAFNAALRTCVPVVGGPESFVQIDTYNQSTTVTKSKGDFTYIPLNITLSNPYNQVYTISWERAFSSQNPVVLNCANSLSCNILRGYDLGTLNNEIGLHVVTVKVRVNNVVVDSHSFQILVSDFPKPTINNATVVPSPSVYNLSFTPLDGPQQFSFTISNNSTLSSTAGWRTTWIVSKNGVLVTSPVLNVGDDTFTTYGSSLTNTAYLGTSTVPTFDPSVLGVGSYTIRAIVQNNTPGEVVDERLWTVTVEHPDFGTIAAVNNPLTSVQTNAFYGIDYPTFGFVDSLSVKGNYCVQVTNPQGTYPDASSQDPTSQGIIVRYYKDGVGSPIYENTTTSVDNTICFSDASAAEEAALFFNDGSSVTPHYKKLVARVFDEQTGLEMCVDGPTCSTPYPIEWNIYVKPQNTAPVMNIVNSQAGDNITYSSAPTNSTSTASATVAQDSTVRIRFRISDDALEHDPFLAAGTNKFRIVGTLKRGAVTVNSSVCAKDFTDPWPVGQTDGGINAVNVTCTFVIASSDVVTGPIAPDPHTLTIQVEDLDSPATIAATGAAGSGGKLGNLLTWNLTVTEAQTAPTVAFNSFIVGGAPVASAAEGSTVTFQLNVNDTQRDTYNLIIRRCTDATCNSVSDFASNSTTQAYGVAAYATNSSISYQIPEDAIGNVASGTLYFKVFLTDIPSNPLLGLPATMTPTLPIMSLTVTQTNPAPTINSAAITPAANNATSYKAFSGNKFQISALTAVADASTVASEGMASMQYRWWIGPAGSNTWTQIDGATSSVLNWTPGPELTAAQDIKLCVTDGGVGHPAVTDDPSIPGAICSDEILVQPRPNLAKLTNTAESLNGEVAVHHVPGERTAYVAYTSNAKIFVEKFTYSADGTLNNSGMQLAVFNAVGTTATAGTVKNLSITATSNHVYVAYMSDTSLAPNSFAARVRMINIANGVQGTKSNTSYAANSRKFDFSYDAISVVSSCTGGTDCIYDPVTRSIAFDASVLTPGTDDIEVTISHPAPFRTGAFNVGVSAASPNPLGTICANCTSIEKAQDFADAVNQSTNAEIQGITASVSGSGIVTLHGVEDSSFYNGTDVAVAVGKIVVDGTKWYLPVVNASLAGANQNKIQLLQDNLGDMTPDTSQIINVDASVTVDNGWTSASSPNMRMLLSFITLSGSQAKTCLLTQASNFLDCEISPITLWTGNAMTIMKGRPHLSNNLNNFFVGKDVGGVWRVARVTSNLSSITRQDTLANYIDTTDPVNSSIISANIGDIDIQPALPLTPATSSNEARLLLTSDFGGSYKTYLMRWKQILSTPFEAIDSSEGQSLEITGESLRSGSKVVLSPISSVTVGDSGNVAADNTNAYTAILKINNSGTGIPEAGIINTEVESINSTSRDGSGSYSPSLIR